MSFKNLYRFLKTSKDFSDFIQTFLRHIEKTSRGFFGLYSDFFRHIKKTSTGF